MDDKIIEFITQYIPLTDDEKDIIREQNLIKFCKKGEHLLSEGEYARQCFFVVKGCIRRYHVIGGEEKTTEFFTENQSINPVSYFKKKPSEYYLSCMEDCVIALGDEKRNKELLEKVPKLETMILKMSSSMLLENQTTIDDFRTLSPELRYQKLLKVRPDLFNRVPLYHIASYLGITPVSLSRMRKRIMTKD